MTDITGFQRARREAAVNKEKKPIKSKKCGDDNDGSTEKSKNKAGNSKK